MCTIYSKLWVPILATILVKVVCRSAQFRALICRENKLFSFNFHDVWWLGWSWSGIWSWVWLESRFSLCAPAEDPGCMIAYTITFRYRIFVDITAPIALIPDCLATCASFNLQTLFDALKLCTLSISILRVDFRDTTVLISTT
jgi:hypothetical protein